LYFSWKGEFGKQVARIIKSAIIVIYPIYSMSRAHPKKQYVIRKYILARSAAEALRIEYKFKADDCWLDDDWKKNQKEVVGEIGFKTK